MMCPAVSCFPLLRELPHWPCLLSWTQCHTGEPWTRTSTQVTEVTPPVCPDKAPSWRKSAGVGSLQSPHHTEPVNTEQKEGSEPQSCSCPCSSSCQWKGILGSVVPHLIQTHQPLTSQDGEEAIFLISNINMPEQLDWVMLQCCFKQSFVLVVRKEAVLAGSPTSFFAAVLLVGLSEEAEGFVYRLELRGSRRRLMWEATPRLIQHGLVSSDCMVFDSAVANLFADSGTLGFHVSISRSGSVTDSASPAQERPSHKHRTGRDTPTSLIQGSPSPQAS